MVDAATGDPRPLDDLMLAMDVVDTIRHNERLVARELSSEQRDEALLKRLRDIYAAQGIEVSDRVLRQGVQALEEKRFHYRPPAAGLQTWLATLYVKRGRWLKPVLTCVAVLVILGLGYRLATGFLEQEQTQAVAEAPQRLAGLFGALGDMARDPEALEMIAALRSRSETALSRGDVEAIETVETELEALGQRLEQEYVLRVVSRPGEASGVYRVPADNPAARNYYLIVEAIGGNGAALTIPVTSEEDGKTKNVQQWGMRVSARDYERVAADKRDDGIIQNREIAVKERGFLAPSYVFPVPGGAITAW